MSSQRLETPANTQILVGGSAIGVSRTTTVEIPERCATTGVVPVFLKKAYVIINADRPKSRYGDIVQLKLIVTQGVLFLILYVDNLIGWQPTPSNCGANFPPVFWC